jgi:hypothetical protein
MARARNKSGGPTRGRKLVRKLGMNSGKRRGKLKKIGR